MKSILAMVLTLTAIQLLAQENIHSILDQHYQAIGGKTLIDRIENIYSLADCSGPNGAYQTEVYSAEGTKTYFRQIRENRPDYIGVVHGESYWTKGKEIAISNKNVASMWRSHEVQWIATHLMERFREAKLEGIEEFQGKSAFKLSVMDEVNKRAYLYFDKSSHLFCGYTLLNPFTEKEEWIHMIIDTWERVGDILLPSKVTFRDKNGEYLLHFHTMKINELDTTVFEVPKKITARNKLLELHELQRTAHFNGDAELLVSILAEEYTEIRNGLISKPKKEDLIKRFQNYFDAITFEEWDDLQPPIIEVSEDGTLAHMIVNKRVVLKINGEIQEPITYAWTATFENFDGSWLITSITSTALN